ncbi:MAG: hypothetical protein AAGN66_25700 [Acidobacteriota bacterium]
MKKKVLLTALVVCFLGSSALLASATYPRASYAPTDPALVTQTTKVRLTEIAEQGRLRVVDPKTEEVGWIQIGEDTEMRAQKKKDFDGRRKLELADLAVGQMLRITHMPETGQIVRIQVLKKKS